MRMLVGLFSKSVIIYMLYGVCNFSTVLVVVNVHLFIVLVFSYTLFL